MVLSHEPGEPAHDTPHEGREVTLTLSRREREILDEIADGLTEQDPALVAEFARPRPRVRSRLPVPLSLREVGLLVLALVVLILASPVVGEFGATGTAIVPWLMISTRSAAGPRVAPGAQRTSGQDTAAQPRPPR
jgi:hypothetical protein